MAFGLSYSYSLIRILYGQKWSDGEASTALKYYTLYIVILAVNGTSEAFLHAVATENSLSWVDICKFFELFACFAHFFKHLMDVSEDSEFPL